MKLMHLVLTAALVLATCAFGGCTSLGLNTDAQKIEASCATATTAVQALTVANQNGKLSVSQQASVAEALEITTPICTAETPPTLDDLKQQAFARAVAILQQRVSEL